MRNWVSVEDKLPNMGKDVLVYKSGNILIGTLAIYNECTHWAIFTPLANEFFLCKDVTHWQPLPEPPK